MRARRRTKLAVGFAVAGLLVAGLAGAASAANRASSSAVPEWLEPVASSWASAEQGYVLGWTPCDEQNYCAALISTDDGGETWTELQAPADLEWTGAGAKRVQMLFTERDGKMTGLVMNNYAPVTDLFATYDGGKSWEYVKPGPDWLFDASLAVTSSYVYVMSDVGCCGDYETHVYRSPRGESRWERVTKLTGYEGSDSQFAARGNTGVAWISEGDFDVPGGFWTTGDGSTWKKTAEPPCGGYLAVGGQGRVYSYCGSRFMVSDDGGATFSQVSNGPGLDTSPTDTAAAGDTVAVASRYPCALDMSFDGGKSWQRTLEVDELAEVVDVQLTDEGTGTALCSTDDFGGSTVYRTTDGGESWQPLNLTGGE